MKKRPEYDKKETGKNMQRLRKAKCFSVEQVRDYMQLGSVQAIYKWERGECFPQADNLLALAFLYEVSPEVLMVKKRTYDLQKILCFQNARAAHRWIRRIERYYFCVMLMLDVCQLSDDKIAGFIRRRLEMVDSEEILEYENCMLTEFI